MRNCPIGHIRPRSVQHQLRPHDGVVILSGLDRARDQRQSKDPQLLHFPTGTRKKRAIEATAVETALL
jgi:hypothetical protein